jgi:hypothetical protein
MVHLMLKDIELKHLIKEFQLTTGQYMRAMAGQVVCLGKGYAVVHYLSNGESTWRVLHNGMETTIDIIYKNENISPSAHFYN